MSTPAIKWLRQRQIPFHILEYTHLSKGAAFAADALGVPLAQTVKTLVIDLGDKQFALGLLSGDRQLDLKRMAALFHIKRAAMADAQSAERLTGYRVGGISPFGTRQHLETVMDADLLKLERVIINAGRRGAMLEMSPRTIVSALACKVARIAGSE